MEYVGLIVISLVVWYISFRYGYGLGRRDGEAHLDRSVETSRQLALKSVLDYTTYVKEDRDAIDKVRWWIRRTING